MLTKILGKITSGVASNGTNPAAQAAAKIGMIDTIATMFAGRTQQPVTIARRVHSPLATGAALEVNELQGTSAEIAALINGIAAHVLDFDDVALRGHPSAVLVPAIFALGAEIGCSGQDIVNAYVAGYEIWGSLVHRENDMHPIKGWHTTSVFGSVSAAAACAVLFKLDSVRAAHAIGLGATQASGLMANFGSMGKSFQIARAAQSGIVAAKLAKEGYTAGEDVLEHDQGFLKAFSPHGHVDTNSSLSTTPDTWLVVSKPVSIKKYPTCFYTHRALDAALDLIQTHAIDPNAITAVNVFMSREHATILKNHFPTTGLAAKFSIEFAMACAFIHRRVSLNELCDEVVQSDAIRTLMQKISVTETVHYSPDWVGAADTDHVLLTLDGGTRLESKKIRYAKGHAKYPLSRTDTDEKFLACLQYGQSSLDSQALLDKLWALESQQQINNLWI